MAKELLKKKYMHLAALLLMNVVVGPSYPEGLLCFFRRKCKKG